MSKNYSKKNFNQKNYGNKHYNNKRTHSRRKQSSGEALLTLLFDALYLLGYLLYRLIAWLIRVIPQIVYFIWSVWGYKNSEYAKVTHRPLTKLIFDKGAYGEYLIWRHLDKKLEGERRWLFNTYLPRSQNRTTEIDVMLFHASGIYVFESKNYKGWIFGTETRKVWTQCIKPSEKTRTRKYRFLNPIMQNKLHLSAFTAQLSEEQKNIPVHSIILFGNRCHLRSINLSSGNHTVIRLKELTETVQAIIGRTPTTEMATVEAVYQALYPMTQVSDEVKEKHIADIEAELHRQDEANGTVEAVEVTEPIEAPAPAEEPVPVAVPAAEPVAESVTETVAETAEESATETEIATEATDKPTSAAEEMRCPRCGGALVIRTVNKGERKGETFMGCSNFPKCRYTK